LKVYFDLRRKEKGER